MKIFGYKITPLGWVFIFSLLVSLINPILFGLCAGVWMFIAIANFGNTINKDNR